MTMSTIHDETHIIIDNKPISDMIENTDDDDDSNKENNNPNNNQNKSMYSFTGEDISDNENLNKKSNTNNTPGLNTILNNNLAYQYKMRKPVESWKYIETQREDGFQLYTCRICLSSYKHKKSLNKHWRDKHSSIPKPENAGEDETSDDSDNNTSDVESLEKKMNNSSAVSSTRLSLSIKRDRESPDINILNTKKRNSMMIPSAVVLTDQNNNNISSTVKGDGNSPKENPLKNIFQNIFTEYLRNQQTNIPINGTIMQEKKLLSPGPLDLTTSETIDLFRLQQKHQQQQQQQPINLSLLKVILQTLLNNLETETAAYYHELSTSSTNLLKSLKIILADFDENKVMVNQQDHKQMSSQNPLILQASNLLNQNAQSLLANQSLLNMQAQTIAAPVPQPPPVPQQQQLNPFTSIFNIFQQQQPQVPQPGQTGVGSLNGRLPIPPTPESLKPRRHTISERKARPLQPRKSFTPNEKSSHNQQQQQVPSMVSGNFDELSTNGPMPLQNIDQNGPISCPLCSYEARWFSELRAHMVNHSDHRMFGCCYCNYRAKWKWDVAKHMRRCALARHVAHMPNEGLLRMVKYFCPPEGDVLFAYFPKSGYPGVDIDKPISPPPFSSSGSGNINEADSLINNPPDNNSPMTTTPSPVQNTLPVSIISQDLF